MINMTFKEASDELLTVMKTATDPLSIPVHWDNVHTKRSDQEAPFIVVMVRHVAGRQETLGHQGCRSFERVGLLTAEIYTPIGKGLSESYDIAKNIIDAYEGQSTPKGIWFRNAGIRENGRDGEFYKMMVSVEFTYSEVK